MSFNYQEEHLDVFSRIPFKSQESVGEVPVKWAVNMEIKFGGAAPLPNEMLTREQVRKICRDYDDPHYGYICAMAWGAQGLGPSGAAPARRAWEAKDRIAPKLLALRTDKLSRAEAYDLFSGKGKIPGLGPAYFTKLLYFFGPGNHYIMDQWTTKSMILLTGENFIRHTNLGPTRYNTGFNYDLFCLMIDDLAQKLKTNGDCVEQRLFSLGSILRQPRDPWRQHVHDSWTKRAKAGRYDRKSVEQKFASFIHV